MSRSSKGDWAAHFQIDWENRAANHTLPTWLRVVCLAYGKHEANGHARFDRGALAWMLGTPPTKGKPFQRLHRQSVHNAIALAVKHGWLAEGSCSECLIVPGEAIEKNLGNTHARCAVHERKHAQKRSKPRHLIAVAS